MEKDKFIGTHDAHKFEKYVDGSKTGLHNWRNLFQKPSVRDLLDLIMICGIIALYFIYKYETGIIMEALNNCIQNKPPF